MKATTQIYCRAPALKVSLAALETMGLEDLRSEWRRLYGPPPKLRSVELLRRKIAWRLQAEAEPELAQALQTRLGGPKREPATGLLRPGEVVFREWQGVRHEAELLEDGKLAYCGKTYDSLSAVAREITGVRWNGPRFFGLRPDAKATSSAP